MRHWALVWWGVLILGVMLLVVSSCGGGDEGGGATLAGELVVAVRLLGAAEEGRRRLGVPGYDVDRSARVRAIAGRELSAEEIHELLQQGRETTLDDAMDMALELPDRWRGVAAGNRDSF
jgi:hypothetical protein